MQIAVLSSLPTGGATLAAWRITQALSQQGHSCTFFTLEGQGTPQMVPLMPPPESSNNKYWLTSLFNHWTDLTSAATLQQGGTELFSDQMVGLHAWLPLPQTIDKADIIHLHWVAGMLLAPELLAMLQGKKIVWTLHDMNAFTGGCHYHLTCRKYTSSCDNCPLLRFPGMNDESARNFRLKQWVYSSLNPHIVTPSRWLAREAGASTLLKEQPIDVIPNPVDTRCFCPGDRQYLRQILGISEDTFVLLVGAEFLNNPRKNLKIFKQALDIAAPHLASRSVEILTFGGGEFSTDKFKVHALGVFNTQEELAEVYRAADMLVHPSLVDNLPNTLCEAQCCGTPVMSFDTGGCADTMIPGVTGLLVKEYSANALAEALIEVITGDMNWEDMRRKAHQFATEKFQPDAIASLYTTIYQKQSITCNKELDINMFHALMQNQYVSAIASLQATIKSLRDDYAYLEEKYKELKINTHKMHSELTSELTNQSKRTEHILSHMIHDHIDEINIINTNIQLAQNEIQKNSTELSMIKNHILHPINYIIKIIKNKFKK